MRILSWKLLQFNELQTRTDHDLNNMYIKLYYFPKRLKVRILLTTEKRLQAKELDLPLPLYQIWCVCIWSTGAGPVHLTLAETDCVDIMADDFQDEASVHHVQQAAGENPLFVVGNVLCVGEAQLLQVHGPEQLLLVDHGAEVSVEQPAAMRVTDRRCGTHFLPSVQELHLQVCHWATDK